MTTPEAETAATEGGDGASRVSGEWTAGGGTTPAFLTFRRVAAGIFGVLALALIAFLAVGFLLSGEWEASATGRVAASPEAVYRQIESPAGWVEWSDWGDVGGEPIGPGRGEGAGWHWDSERYGTGTLTITAADPPSRIDYRVEIEDGALVIQGSISLESADGETRIHWRESGDFGANPLLGYVARTMPANQSAQLRESIDRLGAAAGGGDGDTP